MFDAVNLVVDEVVGRVFKGAGQSLPFQIDRDKPRAGVDGFVTRMSISDHANIFMTVDIPFGSRQCTGMKILFLQRR